jgi:predicted O-linked N-acetylglucosamine transferase (SPINDLY family)
MDLIKQTLDRAWQHYQTGQWPQAEQLYHQVLAVNPDNVDALHLLAAIAGQTGRESLAVDYLRAVLRLQPGMAAAHNNLGNALAAQKKFVEAIASLQEAVRLRPDDAMAHNNLERARHEAGRLAHEHLIRGVALAEQRQLLEAMACFQESLRLRPDFAEAHNNLGNALCEAGRYVEAEACLRRALGICPDYPEALYNLGNVLLRQRRWKESLGNHEEAQEKLTEAVACYRLTLERKPDHAEAHLNLGNVSKEQEDLDEVVACYRRALERKPDYAEAHLNLGNVSKEQGDLDEAVACYRRALELKPDYADAHSNLLLTLQYRTEVTPTELAKAHAEYDQQHAATMYSSIAPHEKSPNSQTRLRVGGAATNPGGSRVRQERGPSDHRPHSGECGYIGRPPGHLDTLRVGFVSPDLGRHPVGYFLVRVLENLNREQFETTCYSDRPAHDDLTARLQAAASHWRDVKGRSDDQLAEQIRADRIDILFDLAGHTAHNRLLVFARRPAPVQITWAGYVGTTGLKAMDYLLADRFEIPPQAEADYCETVLRMPDGYVCYEPPSYAPAVSALPALAKGSVTFGCFNNPAKINPQIVAVWAKILRRLPASQLVLKYRGLRTGRNAARLIDEFADHGIDPHRVTRLGSSPHVELLAAYHHIDVALDPFPYSGGLTTCEALWMGVPVVTCPGPTFASRHSLSHLSNVGLTETIATDLDEYVELAVALAGDLPRLAALRSGLRDRMAASPLCDGPRFAANLGALLHDVWERWIGSVIPMNQPGSER